MRKRLTLWAALILFLVAVAGFNLPNSLSTKASAGVLQLKTRAEIKHDLGPGIRVMTIGSSVAAGWGDPYGGGYLARAFRQLSSATQKNYKVISWAVPGITSTQVAPHYAHWLAFVHPQIVVISWGGLDDASNHTPISTFSSQVHQEIALALAAGASVDIVTPPVTEAVYEDGPKGLPYQYFLAEMREAKSFDSPQIHIYDVYDQMIAYMKAHDEGITPFVDNSWHPNALGHEVGGDLLFADMAHTMTMPVHVLPLTK